MKLQRNRTIADMIKNVLDRLLKLSDFNDSITVLKYVLYPTGLLPFYFDKSDFTYKISPVQLFIATVNFVIIILCYFSSTKDEKEISDSYFKSEVSHQLGLIYRFYPIVSASFLFGVTFFKKNKLLRMLTMFYQLDKSIKVNYSDVRSFICKITALLFVIQIINVIAFVYHLDVDASLAIIATTLVPPFFIWLYILVFITFANIIKLLLSKINNELTKLGRILPNGYHFIQVDFEKSEKYLSDSRKLHDKISDICDCFHEYFGLKILLIIGLSFVYLVFVAYYGLEMMFSPKDFDGLNRKGLFALITVLLICSSLQIVSIVESCRKIVEKNRCLAINLQKLLNISESSYVKEKLIFFIMQSSNRPMEFTAAAMFQLDRSLYFTVCI